MNYSSGFCFLRPNPPPSPPPPSSVGQLHRSISNIATADGALGVHHRQRCSDGFSLISPPPHLSECRLVYFPRLSTLTTSSGRTKITIKTNGRIINASGTRSSWSCSTWTQPTPSSGGFLFSTTLCYFSRWLVLSFFSGREDDEKKLVGEECKTRSAELWNQIKSFLLWFIVARHLSATQFVAGSSPLSAPWSWPNLKWNHSSTDNSISSIRVHSKNSQFNCSSMANLSKHFHWFWRLFRRNAVNIGTLNLSDRSVDTCCVEIHWSRWSNIEVCHQVNTCTRVNVDTIFHSKTNERPRSLKPKRLLNLSTDLRIDT